VRSHSLLWTWGTSSSVVDGSGTLLRLPNPGLALDYSTSACAVVKGWETWYNSAASPRCPTMLPVLALPVGRGGDMVVEACQAACVSKCCEVAPEHRAEDTSVT
jgi:hypothetical protein